MDAVGLTYLYAGMGVAMLAAIMAMFEMASTLTDQQIFASPPLDPYLQSTYQSYDKSFLKLARSMDSSWDCKRINEEIEVSDDLATIRKYKEGVPSESLHQRLLGSCPLSNGPHRVLIAPSPAGSMPSHRVFSCILQNEVDCSFERKRG